MPLERGLTQERKPSGVEANPASFSISLCGRCPQTGHLGFAILSSKLASAGQSGFVHTRKGLSISPINPDKTLSSDLFDGLKTASSAKAALADALSKDSRRRSRQTLIITNAGETAAHSGRDLGGWRGHLKGQDIVAAGAGLSVETELGLAVAKFKQTANTELLLSERLLLALERPYSDTKTSARSAALFVIADDDHPEVDLRVDYSPAPLNALRKTYDDYMSEDIKLDALLPSRDDPTGISHSSLFETKRWLVRNYRQIRSVLSIAKPNAKE